MPGLYALAGTRGVTFYTKGPLGEVKIGKASDWTLDEARVRCRDIRQAGDRGEDLRPVKLPTIRDAFAMFAAVRLAKRRPRTANEYRRQLELYLFPRWGNRPIDRLARADVVQLHAELMAVGKAVRANRLMATISSLYGWLRRDGGFIIENPAAGIERNAEHGREVFLDPSQVARLRDALQAYGSRGRGTDVVADCIEYVLATGCRSGEAMTARWDQLDPALTISDETGIDHETEKTAPGAIRSSGSVNSTETPGVGSGGR